MCGISGLINKRDQTISNDLIQEMNRCIAHRGPDGEGFFHGNNFAFGHRRLSILDLSEDGAQPMHYLEKLTITYNGEIYNYIELREELAAKGYSFRSQSDTEVILAAYDAWGNTCVNRFNGMWAFALYDQEKEVIFCSRDRFGIKPFYFISSEQQFAFGSEIKQILPFVAKDGKHQINQKILLDYLILGFEEHTKGTFFKGIEKLLPGTNLIYDLKSHQYKEEAYYSLAEKTNPTKISQEEAVAKYKEVFTSAVQLRMRSDVEVGTCLSGGLDSSSVTAIASQVLKSQSSAKIKAIHAHVDEEKLDESNFAKQVSEYCETDLHLIKPSSVDFRSSVEDIIRIQEEPFGSPSIILQYFVLKKARELNCLVMLDGQGGDETLLGYERYYPSYLLAQKGTKKWKEFLNSSKNSRLSKIDLLKYFIYFTSYAIRLKKLKQRHQYIKPSILAAFQSEELREMTISYKHIIKLQQLEISKTQLPHLLKYEDKNSMANSVETRLPFLDYRCVEAALSIPDEFKIKEGWTKFVLRKAMETLLPENVIWRKSKLGFNAPEKTWLDDLLPEMKEKISKSQILDQVIQKSAFQMEDLDLRTQWRLYNIVVWEDVYQVVWE